MTRCFYAMLSALLLLSPMIAQDEVTDSDAYQGNLFPEVTRLGVNFDFIRPFAEQRNGNYLQLNYAHPLAGNHWLEVGFGVSKNYHLGDQVRGDVVLPANSDLGGTYPVGVWHQFGLNSYDDSYQFAGRYHRWFWHKRSISISGFAGMSVFRLTEDHQWAVARGGSSPEFNPGEDRDEAVYLINVPVGLSLHVHEGQPFSLRLDLGYSFNANPRTEQYPQASIDELRTLFPDFAFEAPEEIKLSTNALIASVGLRIRI